MLHFADAAVRTFMTALTTLTGNQVKLERRGSRAFTDGNTIVLPALGSWDREGFRHLCGLVCHELSHVWFRSLDLLDPLLQEASPSEHARVRLVFNTVLDVADESRFEQAMPASRDLFEALARDALQRVLREGQIPHRPPAAATAWQLLVAGIWLVRSAPRSDIRKSFWGWAAPSARPG